jgi:hypothetical protein
MTVARGKPEVTPGGPVAPVARDDDQIRAIGRHPERNRIGSMIP